MSNKKKDLLVIIIFLIAVAAGAAHMIALKQTTAHLFLYLLSMGMFIIFSYFHVGLAKRAIRWKLKRRNTTDVFDDDLQPSKWYLIDQKVEAWGMLFVGLMCLYIATLA